MNERKSNAKFIVFVTDAPGHGLKYTDDDYEYPDGIEGRKDIEESIEHQIKNVKNALIGNYV